MDGGPEAVDDEDRVARVLWDLDGSDRVLRRRAGEPLEDGGGAVRVVRRRRVEIREARSVWVFWEPPMAHEVVPSCLYAVVAEQESTQSEVRQAGEGRYDVPELVDVRVNRPAENEVRHRRELVESLLDRGCECRAERVRSAVEAYRV